MVLGEWEYRAKRIRGSLRVSTVDEGARALDLDDEIVIYDSGPYCVASRRAYRIMKDYGYQHVRCYPGGLEEWERMGYPLEGEFARRRGLQNSRRNG
jgi:3-mercaptopyruvate sulfurtransferase SseA